MKCPDCGKNHKARDGMVCFCSYVFTFNPKLPANLGLTDGKFMAAYRKASQNGTMFFTLPQLYSAYCSQVKSNVIGCYVISGVALLFGIFLMSTDMIFGLLGFGVAALSLGFAAFYSPPVMSLAQFRTLQEQWSRAGKQLPGILVEPSLHQPPPDWREDDIFSYGVERILVVSRDILVDLLVRNNMHSEHRTLVISESGYPEYLAPVAGKLLKERPDLPVFLLHDATSDAQQMANRVRKLDWLPIADHPLIDIGLKPSDFERIKRTKNFDNRRSERDLPVDALQTLFLVEGLALCFNGNIDFAAALTQYDGSGGTGSNFG